MNPSIPPISQSTHVDAQALMSLHDRHGVTYPSGRVLFREGDTTSDLYVVLRGRVMLLAHDASTGTPRIVRVVGPCGYFGEYACFGREPHRNTAVVHENDTALLIFSQTTAVELLRESPRFMIDIINELACRLLELEVERNDLRRGIGNNPNLEFSSP